MWLMDGLCYLAVGLVWFGCVMGGREGFKQHRSFARKRVDDADADIGRGRQQAFFSVSPDPGLRRTQHTHTMEPGLEWRAIEWRDGAT